MNIPLIMLVTYVALSIAICVVVAKKAKGSAADFLTAKGNLPWFFVVPLLFAELTAGAATIGKAATGYTTGISGVWVNWGMSIGIVLFLLLVLKFYSVMHRKYGIISVPEVYRVRFDQRCRIVMLIVVVISYCFIYSSQPISAAALIAPMLNLDTKLVAWAVSALFIVVTLLGGMKGLAILNLVHMIVMYTGIIMTTYGSLGIVGGLSALQAALPASYFDLFQPNLFDTLANAMGTSISFFASVILVTGIVSAKSEKDMKIGSWLTALVIIPFAVFPALVGMCAAVVLPGIEPNTVLFAMSSLQGPYVSGMVSMAIVAAIWSTAPAALIFMAITLTQDLYSVVKKDVTDKQKKVFSKICIVVLGVVATWLGMNASSILGQIYAAFQIRSVVAIVLLVAVYWPRVSSTAAFWSMLSGGVLAAVWHIAGNPLGMAPLWPACGLTIVVLVALTLASKEPIAPGHKLYLEGKEELEAANKSA